MGYRSDVDCLIYGNPDKMAGLIMKFRLSHPFNLFGENQQSGGFGKNIRQWQHDGVAYLHLHGEGWKWYDSYPEVKAWEAFEAMAVKMGLAYEFARVGEDEDDTVVDRVDGEGEDGQQLQHLVGISRRTYCDAPESDDVP